MHELSIAQSLVESAQQAAADANVDQVTAVRVRLGALAGVEKEALLFSYGVATVGTLLEGSILEIEEVPIVLYCASCDRLSLLEGIQPLRCTACNRPTADIRQGRELQLLSLEVPDGPPDH